MNARNMPHKRKHWTERQRTGKVTRVEVQRPRKAIKAGNHKPWERAGAEKHCLSEITKKEGLNAKEIV